MEFYNLAKNNDLNNMSPFLLLLEIKILQQIEMSDNHCIKKLYVDNITQCFIGNEEISEMYITLLQHRGLLEVIGTSAYNYEHSVIYTTVRSEYKKWSQLDELRAQIAVGAI